MQYQVVVKDGIEVQEFDYFLPFEMVLNDGDLEPDLTAQLVASGKLEAIVPTTKKAKS